MQSIVLFNMYFIRNKLLSDFLFLLAKINMSVNCFSCDKFTVDLLKLVNEVAILRSLKSIFLLVCSTSEFLIDSVEQHLVIIFIKIYKPTFFFIVKFLHFLTCTIRGSHEIGFCLLIHRFFDKCCQPKINQHYLLPSRTI